MLLDATAHPCDAAQLHNGPSATTPTTPPLPLRASCYDDDPVATRGALGSRRLAFAHLPVISLALLAVFGFFVYDALSFRRKLDQRTPSQRPPRGPATPSTPARPHRTRHQGQCGRCLKRILSPCPPPAVRVFASTSAHVRSLAIAFASVRLDGFALVRLRLRSSTHRSSLPPCLLASPTPGYRRIGDGGFAGKSGCEASTGAASFTPSPSCRVQFCGGAAPPHSRGVATGSAAAGSAAAAATPVAAKGMPPAGLALRRLSRPKEPRHPLLSRSGRSECDESHSMRRQSCESARAEVAQADGRAEPEAPEIATSEIAAIPEIAATTDDGGGGAAAAASEVVVSGWLYKSPSRLGPPTGAAPHRPSCAAAGSARGNEAHGPRGDESGIDPSASSPQRRLSRVLMSLVTPQTGGGEAMPSDKRYFVLRGHELRCVQEPLSLAPCPAPCAHTLVPPPPLCLPPHYHRHYYHARGGRGMNVCARARRARARQMVCE